ncbi:serine protease snake-like isoform X3 [Zophobas morio]|uniref:serine protease snake-like isoform X3 n=1 Tax=Zophobas morio TaxID=2755281 RepID=UPI003082A21D
MYKFLIVVIVIFVKNVYTQSIIGNSCSLEPSNSPGVCKLLTQCQEIRDQVVFSHKLPQTCGFERTQAIVCCPKTRQPGYISQIKCREYTSYTKEKQLCGHHIVKRVVGGVPTGRTDFPHMAALGFQIGFSDEYRWLCGGSLISEQYILTAAHCLFSRTDGEPKVVLLGVTNLNDTYHRHEKTISKTIPHPEYNSSSHYHDIGLVKLKRPIEMSSYVRPACLNTHFDIPVGKVIATGWGDTHSEGGRSEDLLKVTLDITEYELCNKTYQVTRKLRRGIINEMHICTGRGKEQKDTCQGDAGGPLQIYHNNDATSCMYDIVGVISFGKECNGDPAVNTRVSHYIKWIEDTVWPQSTQ